MKADACLVRMSVSIDQGFLRIDVVPDRSLNLKPMFYITKIGGIPQDVIDGIKFIEAEKGEY